MLSYLYLENEYQDSPWIAEISIKFHNTVDEKSIKFLIDKDELIVDETHRTRPYLEALGSATIFTCATKTSKNIVINCHFIESDYILELFCNYFLHTWLLESVELITIIHYIEWSKHLDWFLRFCKENAIEISEIKHES